MGGEKNHRTTEDLEKELDELRHQLDEANDTIEAIRTGQVDALVVRGQRGHQLYTLKSADQTYRVFIEKMTEGAVTLNGQGLILYCNSQFALMVKRPLSSVIGMHFFDFVETEDISRYKKLFERSWTEDCKGEITLVSGEDRKPVQLSLTTLDLDEGFSLSIILTDLTAQKLTQEQLKQNNEKLELINHELEISNHDLQQFASVASHDLQEPLRKIQVFSNLLREKQNALTPQSIRYLDRIISSSGRMKALILDILSYSRLSANNNETQLTDLNDIIKEVKDDFELIILDKGAKIDCNDLPVIEVNKGQIRQVFQNIISNALKFSKLEVAPVITISAKRIRDKSFNSEDHSEGPYYLINIQDNGIGFDEQYAANIFALFQRLNSKDKYEGTGIGLAIAKKIIDKHNGLISANSKENEGANFKIILPVSQAQI